MSPRITVLMPVYNGEKHIGEAVQSVLDQSFSDFELVIVNDGSTDGTLKVLAEFQDPRIKIITQANGGVSAALNTGLKNARAPLVARFDADDVCYPQRLQVQFDFMSAHPEYLMVGCDAHYMTEEGEIIHLYTAVAHTDNEIREKISKHCCFIHSSVMYRTETVKALGGYAVEAHTFEDHFLWTRLIYRGKVCNLPQALMKVRFNASSVTIDEKDQDPEFRQLKRKALDSGVITAEEEKRILQSLHSLDPRRKKASYHRLLGKKFLWDNYQPRKARRNLFQALRLEPASATTHILFFLSFFPKGIIQWLYQRQKSEA